MGIVQRHGNVFRGYFPKNYVKEKPRANPAPAPPPRPQDLKKVEIQSTDEAAPLEDSFAKSATVSETATSPTAAAAPTMSRVVSQRRSAYSLRSLTAFDDLSEQGYAVEVTGGTARGAKAAVGDRIEVQLTGQVTIIASFTDALFTLLCYRYGMVHHQISENSAVGPYPSLLVAVKLSQAWMLH